MAIQTITLQLGGMSCEGCASHVQESLSETEGVVEATVDLEAATAEVTFDPDRTDLRALVDAVEDAGYQAREATVGGGRF